MHPLNVILVDDDEFLLNVVRRMLQRSPIAVNLVAVSDIDAFKQALIDNPRPDMVICDYVMPTANGLELLEMCRQQFPFALRVLMTGDHNANLLSRPLNVVHAYVGKPFKPEDLHIQLRHADNLRSLGISVAVREKLGQQASFPVCPGVLQRLQSLIAEGADLHQVADTLSHDPVIVAKVLQLANSVFLGFQRQTNAIDEAVSRLGTNLVTSLVAALTLSAQFAHRIDNQTHQKFLAAALHLATVTKAVARDLGLAREQQDLVFAAAILSDVGQLIMLADGTEASQIYERANMLDGVPDYLCISAYVLQIWGYSPEFCQLILNLQQEAPLANVNSESAHRILFVAKRLCAQQTAGSEMPTQACIDKVLAQLECQDE